LTADAAGQTFTGSGGQRIFWRTWLPQQDPRAVVLIAHGFGEHSGRYEHVADRLVAEQLAVYALDHQGHGRSSGSRALISLPAAVRDLDWLVSLAQERHPDAPRFLLGHSMGGAIALRYALAHQDRLAGLILSGPLVQVEGRAVAKTFGRLLGAIAPNLPVARLDPKLVSRDPAVVEAYERDPLVHHGPLPAGTAASFLRHAATLPDAVSQITLPTLLLWGTADKLCAPAGSEMVASRIGSADLIAVPYEGLYHEILNEPEQDQVLDEICGWITARLAGAQSMSPSSSKREPL